MIHNGVANETFVPLLMQQCLTFVIVAAAAGSRVLEMLFQATPKISSQMDDKAVEEKRLHTHMSMH